MCVPFLLMAILLLSHLKAANEYYENIFNSTELNKLSPELRPSFRCAVSKVSISPVLGHAR